MSRELMPKSGIMMPHVVVNRDAAVVGVSTVDGVAGAVDLTGKYLQKTDAAATYQTKAEGASKTYVLDSIQPVMEGALFKADPFVDNNIPFRSAGANGVESVDMIKVTPENSIKLGSYESSVQGVEIHSAGRVVVVDKNDSGVETKYPVYSKRFRPEIEDLPFAAIGSYVKDSKGRTIGVNRTGINSDIKQLTQKVTFTQPVTVPDAVGDYDAVTLRQLRNSGGGSGGPTMSGISNFGIGDFHLRDSRAFIPAFEVPSDGQLLNRADYPDLWAYAQLLTPISDAEWLGDAQKRGKYSTGDGSITFRVPDRNGVQSGSISGLYARGDGGNSVNNGTVQQNAAPDITGETVASFSTVTSLWDLMFGAFSLDKGNTVTQVGNLESIATASSARKANMSFKASRSAASYGRDNTTEVRTNSFVGVWTIRAHGGFTAANTSWSVIDGDATLPGNSTALKGGALRSVYQINGVDHMAVTLRASGTVGGNYTPMIEQVAPSGGSPLTKQWTFPQTAGELLGRDSLGTSGAKIPLLSTANTWSNTQVINGLFYVNGDASRFSRDGGNVNSSTGPSIVAANTSGTGTINSTNNGGLFSSEVRGQSAFFGCREFVGTSTNGIIAVQVGGNWKNFYFRNDGNGYASSGSWVNSSDERFKDNITRIADPLHVVASLRGCSWVRKDSGDNGIGLIAQDVERVLPDAIKTGNPDMTLPDKTVIKDPLAIDTGSIGAAVSIEAIKALMSVMKESISTVASTTSDETAKATLLALANKIPDVS